MLVRAPNPRMLQYLLRRSGLSLEKLAKEAGLSPRRLQQWLSGKAMSVYQTSKAEVARALSCDDPDQLDSEPPTQDDTSSNIVSGTRALLDRIVMQDCKNVIKDESVSGRLLKPGRLPSFAECIAAAATVLPFDDAHKDALFTRLGYNHFIQAGAVISIEAEESDTRNIVAYHRT